MYVYISNSVYVFTDTGYVLIFHYLDQKMYVRYYFLKSIECIRIQMGHYKSIDSCQPILINGPESNPNKADP